ncbi:uncharacterized protein LOC124161065 [Ischnura elegans]|uniref:uncharacterized protein LOC124161065 n=1 Tax=Ischnura elegans TaxID=197161 RepID=UPI001ED8AD70|nr:uncharacterized protein LOC124161065 [Ischnura elegans]
MNNGDADEKAYLSRNRDVSRYHTNDYRMLYTYVVEGLESARDTRSTSLKGDVDEPKRKRKVTFSDSHVEFAYLERDPVAPYLLFIPEPESLQWLHCGENCVCGTVVERHGIKTI